MEIPESQDLLGTHDVARRLGVTPQTVTRLTRTGRLASVRIGGRTLVSRASLEAHMAAENLEPAPSDHPCRDVEGAPADASASAPVTAVSFFSGALGLDLGMEEAGVRASLLCENDVKCRMTIQANRPAAGLLGDIQKVTAEQVFRYSGISRERGVDVMFGGPPCQAFSTAGARRAFDDARGNIFLKYLELAAEIRPRYLVIENVRGLLSTAYPLKEGGAPVHGGALRIILNRLDDMGYGVSFNLYNAANYGAAQIRERLVIIAKRDGSIMPWLAPTNAADPSWGLPPWRTLREVVPEDPDDARLHFSQFPEKRLRYFRMLGEGQYWKDLPEEVQPAAMGKAYDLTGGRTGFYRRLSWDRPSPTLVTSPTMPATDLCHPVRDRPLAVEEYASIQGFPETWVFRGGVSDEYRQIGNAVPVALGRAVARAILADMHGGAPVPPAGFPFSRYRRTNQDTWRG